MIIVWAGREKVQCGWTQKRKTSVFRLKSHPLEESLLQSFFVENCQRRSCKAFIGLTIRAKMIGGGRPLLRQNLAHTNSPAFKTPICDPIRP